MCRAVSELNPSSILEVGVGTGLTLAGYPQQAIVTGIDLSPIQTHHFSLTDAAEAFELGKDPQACIKVTLSMKGLN